MTGTADPISGRQRRVIVGRISGIQGVSGWVKVYSYTRPKENILDYSPWLIGHGEDVEERAVLTGKASGNKLLASIDGIIDRDQARQYIGRDIAVYREQLPELPQGQYYWCDLLGLEVINLAGLKFGKVTGIQETGANDVLEIEGEQRHLVPLILDHYVKKVDLSAGQLIVDWEPGYS